MCAASVKGINFSQHVGTKHGFSPGQVVPTDDPGQLGVDRRIRRSFVVAVIIWLVCLRVLAVPAYEGTAGSEGTQPGDFSWEAASSLFSSMAQQPFWWLMPGGLVACALCMFAYSRGVFRARVTVYGDQVVLRHRLGTPTVSVTLPADVTTGEIYARRSHGSMDHPTSVDTHEGVYLYDGASGPSSAGGGVVQEMPDGYGGPNRRRLLIGGAGVVGVASSAPSRGRSCRRSERTSRWIRPLHRRRRGGAGTARDRAVEGDGRRPQPVHRRPGRLRGRQGTAGRGDPAWRQCKRGRVPGVRAGPLSHRRRGGGCTAVRPCRDRRRRSGWVPDGDGADPRRLLLDELPRWLAKRGYDPDRRAVWGWSRGGLGALRPVEVAPRWARASVLFSPAVVEGPDAFTNLRALVRRPLGVWCGDDDPVVDAVHDLVDALPVEPEVVTFAEGGHDREF